MSTQAETNKDAVKQAARKYVDRQLKIMKDHGSPAKISKSTYEQIVKQVMRVSAK